MPNDKAQLDSINRLWVDLLDNGVDKVFPRERDIGKINKDFWTPPPPSTEPGSPSSTAPSVAVLNFGVTPPMDDAYEVDDRVRVFVTISRRCARGRSRATAKCVCRVSRSPPVAYRSSRRSGGSRHLEARRHRPGHRRGIPHVLCRHPVFARSA